jgi:flagellar hook assembly protein FlgD
MKTLVLTAALVVLTAASFAQKVLENGQELKTDDSKVKVAMYSNVSDEVTFIVVKEPEDKLNLKIKDERGSLVYEKRLRKPENRKITFDIKSLPEGKYTFELAKGKEIVYANSISKGAASIALSK